MRTPLLSVFHIGVVRFQAFKLAYVASKLKYTLSVPEPEDKFNCEATSVPEFCVRTPGESAQLDRNIPGRHLGYRTASKNKTMHTSDRKLHKYIPQSMGQMQRQLIFPLARSQECLRPLSNVLQRGKVTEGDQSGKKTMVLIHLSSNIFILQIS